MRQLDLISNPLMGKRPVHRVRALLASCAFHGLALGSLVALTLVYRFPPPPQNSGSAPGAPSLSMETMVIVSPPTQPPAPPPPKPAPIVSEVPALPAPAPGMAAPTPAREPEPTPFPPEQAVPILAVQPATPTQTVQSKAAPKNRAATHPATSPAVVATAQSISPKASFAAAATCSSYAPGVNVLPHPPYPTEAREHGQTGTVLMNVQFDVKGDIADAEVTQSSGVPLLDSETRSFIRAHWHSPSYAGQAVTVPVQYKLESH
jgi:protein TonB